MLMLIFSNRLMVTRAKKTIHVRTASVDTADHEGHFAPKCLHHRQVWLQHAMGDHRLPFEKRHSAMCIVQLIES